MPLHRYLRYRVVAALLVSALFFFLVYVSATNKCNMAPNLKVRRALEHSPFTV